MDEKLAHFLDRTNNHIKLVSKAVDMIVEKYPEMKQLTEKAKHHDASKFIEPELTPYIELSWNKFKGIKDTDARTNEATLHHITNNEHHPEYWNKEKANLDPNNRDKSVKVLEAYEMTPLALAEMVADWQAMTWELKQNTARQWYNKQKDARWKWESDQENMIDMFLKVFE